MLQNFAYPILFSSDNNGQVKFVAQRNHPTIVQEPALMLHWGANSDMQFFLLPSNSLDAATTANIDYGEYIHNLTLAGAADLEQFGPNNTCMQYACGYSCKGSLPTKTWNANFTTLMNTLADADGETTTRSFVNKFMRSIAKARDVPRDEALFILAGGSYAHNTTSVKKCSLNSIQVDDVPEGNEAQADNEGQGSTSRGGKGKFNYASLHKSYKKRLVVEEGFSFYSFTAQNHRCAPNFFGYDSKATWPLSEPYSKAQLLLFIPHRGVDALEVNGSYAEALEALMYHPSYPKENLADILHRKYKWKNLVTPRPRNMPTPGMKLMQKRRMRRTGVARTTLLVPISPKKISGVSSMVGMTTITLMAMICRPSLG
jgi:hypothetical protein